MRGAGLLSCDGISTNIRSIVLVFVARVIIARCAINLKTRLTQSNPFTDGKYKIHFECHINLVL